MWQEARKHERKLRGMMVDYKRRGERRREYYEKIKKDPAQFLQVHGRAYKIHLDPAVALAAESPINMMPWQGDASNMIDRFDVRAHLDYVPTYTPPLITTPSAEQEMEERKCNYERYRGLVQNDFANISEEQCLYQIYVDELYGGLQKPNEDEKKKLAEKKVAIGYTYEDSTVTEPDPASDKDEDNSENSESEEDEVIPDIDVEVDIDELNHEQELDLNKAATPYGMAEGDFVRMLRKDKEEVEAIKHAKALEAEKAMYSGRRSRRQRREFREKRLKGRQISPPSYARRDSPTYDPYKRPDSESSSESRSRSRTPGPEKITFITSFGGSDDEAAAAAAAAAAVAQVAVSHSSFVQHPAGHSRASRRRRSSSSRSPSYSSSASSSRSSSSSSRSRHRSRRRDDRRSRTNSRLRRHSRSHSRDRGGSRRRRERTRSRSRPRERSRERRQYSSRRRTRSRSSSRQGGSSRRSGRTGYRRGESSSGSPSPSPGRPNHSPSPDNRGPPVSANTVTDKLRKPETSGGKKTGAAKSKLTPQEKLKLRMQKALNRQSKADKKAAQVKIQQQEHRRQEREGELRAMARKIRMKERERREKEWDEWERQYGRQSSNSPSPSKHGKAARVSSLAAANIYQTRTDRPNCEQMFKK
ncbi:CLK4-associating serine/arginine rich protein isoform X2 [Syngnathus acus]|uniref:CLK4-associating serine/arginine rich protein isoform X2 n=1 Tax=Syngnathus acus TaxID=161584 RepID=UPI001885B82C|nr:CLK4-associating serine/arginine rich protein isoform X2 [Syngnathus acus]